MTHSTEDPLARFRAALERAAAHESLHDAVVLATADASGRPSARVVLVKGVGEGGVTFFTNLESRKGRDLVANPRAALCAYWKSTDEQVRLEGAVEPVSDEHADAYFATRPRESQLGAWASDQSRDLGSRDQLLGRFEAMGERFAGEPVPRPSFWSGYRLVPDRVEFWSRGAHRLHDRIVFERAGDAWRIRRLFP